MCQVGRFYLLFSFSVTYICIEFPVWLGLNQTFRCILCRQTLWLGWGTSACLASVDCAYPFIVHAYLSKFSVAFWQMNLRCTQNLKRSQRGCRLSVLWRRFFQQRDSQVGHWRYMLRVAFAVWQVTFEQTGSVWIFPACPIGFEFWNQVFG